LLLFDLLGRFLQLFLLTPLDPQLLFDRWIRWGHWLRLNQYFLSDPLDRLPQLILKIRYCLLDLEYLWLLLGHWLRLNPYFPFDLLDLLLR